MHFRSALPSKLRHVISCLPRFPISQIFLRLFLILFTSIACVYVSNRLIHLAFCAGMIEFMCVYVCELVSADASAFSYRSLELVLWYR